MVASDDSRPILGLASAIDTTCPSPDVQRVNTCPVVQRPDGDVITWPDHAETIGPMRWRIDRHKPRESLEIVLGKA